MTTAAGPSPTGPMPVDSHQRDVAAAVNNLAHGRRTALTRLAVAMVLTMTTWFSATAVLPQLRTRWDLTTSMGSWLTIAVQLGFVAGAVVLAATSLSDVVAPRQLMFVGAIGAAVANLGLLIAGGAGGAITLRFLTGAFLAAVYPPAMKSMSTWFREGRGIALGVMVGALTIGSASPHLINVFGAVPWHTVVVVTSVATLLGGALAKWWALDGPYPFPRATFDLRLARRAMSQRGVQLATLGYFGHMWELYAMWAWIGAYYTARFDSSRAGSLLAFAVIGVGAFGSVAGGMLGDRRGRSTSTIVAMVASGAMAATIGFVGNGVPGGDLLVVVMGLVWGFWVVADSAQFSAAVTEHAAPDTVGTALTVQLASGFVLTVATIWLVPVIERTNGWGWAFALLAPGPAIGVLAMQRLRAVREPERLLTGRDVARV